MVMSILMESNQAKLKDREYKFHPNGKTILLEGFNATTLEEEEGAIGIAAVSENLKFGCVLPSLAFSKDNRSNGCYKDITNNFSFSFMISLFK